MNGVLDFTFINLKGEYLFPSDNEEEEDTSASGMEIGSGESLYKGDGGIVE